MEYRGVNILNIDSNNLKLEEALNLVRNYAPDNLEIFLNIVTIKFEDLTKESAWGLAFGKKRAIAIEQDLLLRPAYYIACVIVHELTHIKFYMDLNQNVSDFIVIDILNTKFRPYNEDIANLIKEIKILKKSTANLENSDKEEPHKNSIQEEFDARTNEIKFWKKLKKELNLNDWNVDNWLLINSDYQTRKDYLRNHKLYSNLPEYSEINLHKAFVNFEFIHYIKKQLIYYFNKLLKSSNFFISYAQDNSSN